MWNPFSKRERAIRDGARHFGVTNAKARATLEAAEAYVARAVRTSDLDVAVGVCATCKQAHRLRSTGASRTTGTEPIDARMAQNTTPFMACATCAALMYGHSGDGLLTSDMGSMTLS